MRNTQRKSRGQVLLVVLAGLAMFVMLAPIALAATMTDASAIAIAPHTAAVVGLGPEPAMLASMVSGLLLIAGRPTRPSR